MNNKDFGFLGLWIAIFLIIMAAGSTGWMAVAYAGSAAGFIIMMKLLSVIEKRRKK